MIILQELVHSGWIVRWRLVGRRSMRNQGLGLLKDYHKHVLAKDISQRICCLKNGSFEFHLFFFLFSSDTCRWDILTRGLLLTHQEHNMCTIAPHMWVGPNVPLLCPWCINNIFLLTKDRNYNFISHVSDSADIAVLINFVNNSWLTVLCQQGEIVVGIALLH